MDLQLRGRKAVVTGATRGIGLAIARLLAEEGADVAICARNAAEVNRCVDRLAESGVRAWGKGIDITDAPALDGFIRGAGEQLGGIDVLVSNASALSLGAAPRHFQAMFELDLMGAVRSFHAAKDMLENAGAVHGDAAFLIIASVSAAEAPSASAYGAMKAALIHYAKGLAREYAPKRLRCNVVSPGTVLFDGGVWDRMRNEHSAFFQTMIERNPMGRMASPEEVAAAAVFLASPRSSFTSGINMVVDGALTLRVNY